MKRIFKVLLLLLISLMFINLDILASNNTASLITSNPGEDMSSMINISWHSISSNLVVEYTEASDINFENKLTAEGECITIPFDGKNDTYQCKTTLENLKSDTKYIYRIGNSAQYSFKTAGKDEFSFLHISDIHAYVPLLGRTDTANNLINKAYNQFDNMAFTILTGDATAYGTVYEQWDLLYSMSSIKRGMLAITPGNHDYYNTSANTTNISYFNAVTNNPANGASGLMNSTYYFKYGNTLFISLNSEASAAGAQNVKRQQDWFEEVVQSNPSEFIVCFTHRPFYTGDGLNSGQAKSSRDWWQQLFDKYGVDLVLAGHNHVYARTHQIYNNEVVNEPGEGTVYITGTAIGDRYTNAAGTPMAQVAYSKVGKIDGGAVFTVKNGQIDIKLINTAGVNFKDDYTIYSKADNNKKVNFESSIQLERSTTGVPSVIKFIKPDLNLVADIEVSLDDGTVLGKADIANSEIIELKNLPLDISSYDLNVKITYRDSSIGIKKISVKNLIKNVRIEEEKDKKILRWEISYQGDEVDKFNILVNGQIIHRINNDVNSVDLSSLIAGSNTIEIRILKNSVIIDSYKLEYTYEEIIEVPLPEPNEKNPDVKTGCRKKSSSLYSFSLFGLYFIFRRRRIV